MRVVVVALLLIAAACGRSSSNTPTELFRRTSAGSGVRIRASVQHFGSCVEQLQVELSNQGKSRSAGAQASDADLGREMFLAYFGGGVVAVHTTSKPVVVAWHYDASHFDEMKPVDGWAVLAGEVSFDNASVNPYTGTFVEALDAGGRVVSRVATAARAGGASC